MNAAAAHARTCFVVMPFASTSDAPGDLVDFERIYREIFVPAIVSVELPEGGRLQAVRADPEFVSGLMNPATYELLEHARIVLADITALKPAVFFELGVRHRARGAQTVIVRNANEPVPFDISTMRVFSYSSATAGDFDQSRAAIARVVSDSLRLQRPAGSVIHGARPHRADVHALMEESERALNAGDRGRATSLLLRAIESGGGGAVHRVRAGVLLRDEGRFAEVVEQMTAAVQDEPHYAEVHRELGLAQNKLYSKDSKYPETGEAALLRAIELNPRDYEALCNLGGMLRRAGRYDEALKRYEMALALSNARAYPLLNVLKLRFKTDPGATITGTDRGG